MALVAVRYVAVETNGRGTVRYALIYRVTNSDFFFFFYYYFLVVVFESVSYIVGGGRVILGRGYVLFITTFFFYL